MLGDGVKQERRAVKKELKLKEKKSTQENFQM